MLNIEQKAHYLDKRKREFVENFWLGLGDTSIIETFNSFKPNKDWEIENPHLHLINFMRKPENFSFTCKHLLNIKLHSFQYVCLRVLWDYTFPMLIGCRGFSKSFMLAVFCILKALFDQKSKIIVTGAAYRQAKVVFEYAETIYKNSPILRDILSEDKMNGPRRDIDRCTFRIGDSVMTFIPTGTGDTVRGLRASVLIAEELNSIPVTIYEHILQGFSSVTSTPVENVVNISRIQALKELGILKEEDIQKQEREIIKYNKSIMSGTCGYIFEPFGRYWEKYKKIIESKGDLSKLENLFDDELPQGFDWRDYAIIRMPYNLIPRGFMDIKAISKAKATINTGNFMMEYGAVFLRDSKGFFPMTLIKKATCGDLDSPISFPNLGVISFHGVIKGNAKRKYVYGIDPASEIDNFAITIIECWEDHRRIVYCWTINKKKHREKVRKGLVEEHDYYRYCSRKIRNLMRYFPCERIMLDKQGGGVAVAETLHEPSGLLSNELPIYEIIEEGKEKETDDRPGLHILEFVNFANAAWTSEANHGMKKDMEDRILIFPFFDPVSLGLALEKDKMSGRVVSKDGEDEKLYDTLEDCMLELEDLKRELTTIVHTKTSSGRDHWDTPETKAASSTETSKKDRLRKDRYSALLMANMGARQLIRIITEKEYEMVGGIGGMVDKEKMKGDLYIAPNWFTEKTKGTDYGGVLINRNKK